MPAKESKLTAEQAEEKAGRSLHGAIQMVSLLRPAAAADWPPSELKTLSVNVRERVTVTRAATQKFARHEWDFRARFPTPAGMTVEPFTFLEDAEVLPCHEYEIARLDKKWVGEALAWRKACKERTFSALLNFWCDRWRAGANHPTTEFYVLWPEWPKVPYLLLPPEVRQARLRLWTGRAFRKVSKPKSLVWDPPPLGTVSINHLFAYRDAFGKRTAWSGPYEDAVIGETITFTGNRHPLWRSREYVAFDLRWNDSNEHMVDRFRAWIQKRRCELHIEERELRGSASFTKQMRSVLCAVGAWRLVHKARIRIEGARRDMEKGLREDVRTYTERVSGKPLFEHPRTWNDNLDRIAGPSGILRPVD